MNEGLLAPKIDEASAPPEDQVVPEHPRYEEAPIVESVVEAEPAGPFWLRMAYSFEFLIALVAIFSVLSQVGGQGKAQEQEYRE